MVIRTNIMTRFMDVIAELLFLKRCCAKCGGWFCVRSDGEWCGLDMRTCERCGDHPDVQY